MIKSYISVSAQVGLKLNQINKINHYYKITTENHHSKRTTQHNKTQEQQTNKVRNHNLKNYYF